MSNQNQKSYKPTFTTGFAAAFFDNENFKGNQKQSDINKDAKKMNVQEQTGESGGNGDSNDGSSTAQNEVKKG